MKTIAETLAERSRWRLPAEVIFDSIAFAASNRRPIAHLEILFKDERSQFRER